MSDDNTLSTFEELTSYSDDQPWRPTGRLHGITPSFIQLQRLRNLEVKVTAIPVTLANEPARQLISVSAVESPFKQGNTTVSKVSVSFVRDVSDPNYFGTQIWFTGYHGNTDPVLMPASTQSSPVTFLCDTTGETVTVIAQSVSATGVPSDLAACPTTTVLLDGVISAPPAPSIVQSLVATPTGFQFSFSQLTAFTADEIDGYQVYRNTVNNSSTASKWTYIKHNPQNSSAVVIQDSNVPNGTSYFYWVSAINTTGLESTKTAAQSGSVSSGSTLGPDGNPHMWTGRNLIYNPDFGIYSQPTGLQEILASTIRANDTDNAGTLQKSPNGWTRNFESAHSGEGVIYRSSSTTLPSQGSFALVLQDAQGSTGDAFSCVSDAVPVTAGKQYRVSAMVSAGLGSTFPTHARWYFRVLFYKQAASDFGRSSASLSANTPVFTQPSSGFTPSATTGLVDIANASSLTGTQRPAATITAPADAAFARIAFYHWDDGTATATAWNLVVGDISFKAITADGDAIFSVSTLLNGQGGMVPNQSFAISYTSTSTSISLSWSSASLLRGDGSTLSIASGTQSYTPLSPSTTYWIYAYLDVNAGTVGFANGNPPGTASNSTTAAQAGLDGRVNLSPISVALPASGGGPGGTGGDGDPTCPDKDELVDIQGKGVIPAGEVVAGDYIKGYSFTQQADIYRFVLSVINRPCSSWRMVRGYRVSPTEPVYVNGQWMAAFRVPGATIDMKLGTKMFISVEADEDNEHNYYLVGNGPLLIHNPIIIPRC